MFRTGLTMLAATAAMAAIPATAVAERADGGTPQSTKLVTKGAGSAAAEANADGPTGAMRVSAQATGGRSLLPPPLGGLVPGTGPANAAGVASISRSFGVGAGTYRVTITHNGASQSRSQAGRGGANIQRVASAQFTDAGEGHQADEPVIRLFANDLPASPGTVTTTLVVSVREAGSLFVRGGIDAGANAPAKGDRASASGTVGATAFDVERVE